MNTIIDANLVVEEGAAPKQFCAVIWPVFAVLPGHMPEQVGYVKAIVDRKSGNLAFEIMPHGKQRVKSVDMRTAVEHLRAQLPARRMQTMSKVVEDALFEAIQTSRGD